MNVYIVNCFDTYEHRVDLIYNYFVDRGNSVHVLTSDFRHIKKEKRSDAKQDYMFFSTEPYCKNLSLQRIKSHKNISKNIFSYLEKNIGNVDLLWVMVPPNSFVQDATKIKKAHSRIRLVFDVIDMWPETMPIGVVKFLYPVKWWGDIRDKQINIADCVVTECDLYQEKLRRYVDNYKMKTLYLARMVGKYNSEPNLPDDMISLCYLGSINNIIDIPEIGRIIANYRKQKPVELHIIGDGEKKQKLISTAENAGALVINHGCVYDISEKQKIFDSCHYGLNIYKSNVFIGLTMKSIDYFEAGLPIINNIKGDTWKFVEDDHCGMNRYDEFWYEDRLRQNARKKFEDTFSVDEFIKTMSSLEQYYAREKI